MKIPFINLKEQYHNLKTDIDKAMQDVIESCHFIMGPNIKELEKEIAAYTGAKHAIACASGSDALLLALMAINIKPGDQVITTPFTFFATAGAISRLDAKPVFVDIDPVTFNIDPEQIKKKINSKTKAIIPVHIFGQAANMDEINKIAKENNLKVIEDACQAIGTEYNSKKAGILGDIACFSFFPTKNLGGYGDGGIITTNNNKLAEKMSILRVHGSSPKYFHKYIGINSRLDEIHAAVLRIKLKHLDNWNKKRIEIATTYNEQLKKAKTLILPAIPDDNSHIFHQYAILTEDAKRDEIVKKLNNNGICAGVYYPKPLHLQECFEKLRYKENSLPVTESTCKKVFSIPIFPELKKVEIEFICNTLINITDVY